MNKHEDSFVLFLQTYQPYEPPTYRLTKGFLTNLNNENSLTPESCSGILSQAGAKSCFGALLLAISAQYT